MRFSDSEILRQAERALSPGQTLEAPLDGVVPQEFLFDDAIAIRLEAVGATIGEEEADFAELNVENMGERYVFVVVAHDRVSEKAHQLAMVCAPWGLNFDLPKSPRRLLWASALTFPHRRGATTAG